MDWTEKYRPQTLDSVIGNPTAVNSLRAWARSWEHGIPETRVAVLRGPPGVGKTTSVEALAREMGWSIIEMNASDQRTGKALEDVALRGSMFETFADDGSFTRSSEGGRKLIVLDEADNFYGNHDKGAMPVVNALIKGTCQPVVLIVNDFYELSRKSSAVNDSTLQITFKKPQASTIAKALYKIADAEGVEVDPEAMELIAQNANGDMRAAVRNLESLALGQDSVTLEMAEGLSPRDTRSDIYDLMKAVFLGGDPAEARRKAMDVDEDPDVDRREHAHRVHRHRRSDKGLREAVPRRHIHEQGLQEAVLPLLVLRQGPDDLRSVRIEEDQVQARNEDQLPILPGTHVQEQEGPRRPRIHLAEAGAAPPHHLPQGPERCGSLREGHDEQRFRAAPPSGRRAQSRRR